MQLLFFFFSFLYKFDSLITNQPQEKSRNLTAAGLLSLSEARLKQRNKRSSHPVGRDRFTFAPRAKRLLSPHYYEKPEKLRLNKSGLFFLFFPPIAIRTVLTCLGCSLPRCTHILHASQPCSAAAECAVVAKGQRRKRSSS